MQIKSDIKKEISLWVDIAMADLSDAKILYASKSYRNSYFLFHQAVEKANKAMALFNGKTEKDLKKIGHKQMGIYIEPLSQKKQEVSAINVFLESFPKVKGHEVFGLLDLDKYGKSIEAGINDLANMENIDLVNISLLEIRNLLDHVYEIEGATIRLPKESNIKFIETLRKSVDWISLLEMPDALKLQKEYELFINTKENQEILYDAMKKTLRTINSLSFVLYTFFMGAIFTTQHGTLTRYPQKGKNPIKIYTKRLPLVRDQQEIMDVFERALRTFKRILSAHF